CSGRPVLYVRVSRQSDRLSASTTCLRIRYAIGNQRTKSANGLGPAARHAGSRRSQVFNRPKRVRSSGVINRGINPSSDRIGGFPASFLFPKKRCPEERRSQREPRSRWY